MVAIGLDYPTNNEKKKKKKYEKNLYDLNLTFEKFISNFLF